MYTRKPSIKLGKLKRFPEKKISSPKSLFSEISISPCLFFSFTILLIAPLLSGIHIYLDFEMLLLYYLFLESVKLYFNISFVCINLITRYSLQVRISYSVHAQFMATIYVSENVKVVKILKNIYFCYVTASVWYEILINLILLSNVLLS